MNTSVVRFARKASSTSSLQTAAIAITSSSLSHQLTSHTRKTHQRRNSSSKASIPPNGSPRSRSTAPSAQTSTSSSGRGMRGSRAKAPVVESGFAHLPSVPSTQHLQPEDINVSSFFSLHRPISVTASFPSTTNSSSFAQIFNTNNIMLKHEPAQVIKTLGSVVEELEGGQAREQVEEVGAIMQGDHESMRAGVPRDIPFAKLADFRPFAAPPVPVAQADMPVQRSTRRSSMGEAPSKRSWQTTINVTEEITPTGQKIYTATSLGPMVESMIEEPDTESRLSIQQPFLERMRIRQQRWHAISVKRQRKLKMKKHKYKKLMKRTRNERRRLGKI